MKINGIVVARRNKHRNRCVLQRVQQRPNTLPAGAAVKKIAAEEHHVALLLPTQIHQLPRDAQQLPAQKIRLLVGASGKGGIQMEVSCVK